MATPVLKILLTRLSLNRPLTTAVTDRTQECSWQKGRLPHRSLMMKAAAWEIEEREKGTEREDRKRRRTEREKRKRREGQRWGRRRRERERTERERKRNKDTQRSVDLSFDQILKHAGIDRFTSTRGTFFWTHTPGFFLIFEIRNLIFSLLFPVFRRVRSDWRAKNGRRQEVRLKDSVASEAPLFSSRRRWVSSSLAFSWPDSWKT